MCVQNLMGLLNSECLELLILGFDCGKSPSDYMSTTLLHDEPPKNSCKSSARKSETPYKHRCSNFNTSDKGTQYNTNQFVSASPRANRAAEAHQLK